MQERNYRYAPTCPCSSDRTSRNGSGRGTPDCRGNYPSDNNGQGSNCQMESRGCGGQKENMVLAMAYVPDQIFKELYSPAEAMKAGTIFKELNLPLGGSLC